MGCPTEPRGGGRGAWVAIGLPPHPPLAHSPQHRACPPSPPCLPPPPRRDVTPPPRAPSMLCRPPPPPRLLPPPWGVPSATGVSRVVPPPPPKAEPDPGRQPGVTGWAEGGGGGGCGWVTGHGCASPPSRPHAASHPRWWPRLRPQPPPHPPSFGCFINKNWCFRRSGGVFFSTPPCAPTKHPHGISPLLPPSAEEREGDGQCRFKRRGLRWVTSRAGCRPLRTGAPRATCRRAGPAAPPRSAP